MLKESDWARGLLAGDEHSYEEVRRWIRAAAFPYRDLYTADGEDLEQETLVALLESLRAGRFRGESSLRTYVRKLVHYTCIDRLRTSRTRQMVTIEGLDLPAAGEEPVDRFSRQQIVRTALRVLGQVPAECRDLWRAILAGESYGEMSRKTGISVGALRVRVLRCRRRAVELRNEAPGRPTVERERNP